MSDFSFAQDPVQARMAAAASRQPTPEELQQQSDALYNYRNSFLTPAPVTPPPPPEDTPTSASIAQGLWAAQRAQNLADFNQGVETATTILQSTLKYYGLDDPQLVSDVKTALADRRITGTSSLDDIGIQLRESAAFKQRFAGNQARLAANKPAYSVTQYLQLESSYRQTLNAAGMPADFYNTPEDFQSFIANDISPDEIKARVQQGYSAVKNADPAVVNELKTLYGLDEGTLAAYFIDPNKTKEAVIRSARAAEIAAQSRRQAGIGLNVTQAESLAMQGITESQAQQGFTQIKQQQELLRPTVGEQALTQEELIAGTFGTSGAATQRVATTRRRRQATFQGGGQTSLGTVGQ